MCLWFWFLATQKIKFSIKDFFSKCDQFQKKIRVWSHLLKKFLMENFIFCEASILISVFNKQAVWSYEKVINGFMSLFNFYADSFQECKLQDILHITFFPAGEKVPSYTSKEKYDHLLSVKSFFQFGIQWENGWRVSPHIAVFSQIVGIWKPDKTRILVYFTKCECGY